ncbi:MAG: SDR family oxidoreductase [Acidimicrobiaceae bacterium]|nr:SDR family oxidoreductase [Acidimicrobiaceae bacterium]
MTGRLEGQVAVVTGGGRGFGRWIARGLAAEGAAVVVTSRTASELERTVELIEDAGGRAMRVVGDVTRLEDMQEVRARAEKSFGTVTLAVHNAGVPWPFGPTWYVDPARWWTAQSVHVLGALHCVRTFVPAMIDHGGGRVIVVSSRGGTRLSPNMSGYGVAKGTQIRLVEFLAVEAKEHGVAAFSIHPGSELTGISDLTMDDPDAQRYVPWFVQRLSGRKGTNEDPTAGFEACAELCVKLGSGKFDRLTGRFLTPDDDLDALEPLPEPEARG